MATTAFDLDTEVRRAEQRIRSWVQETPVEESAVLGGGDRPCRVHLKLENLQRTGSFKLRGAFNKLLVLSAPERAKGIVAASSGNHGAAVACAAAALSARALVFVPQSAPAHKVEAIAAFGAEVRREGDDCVVTEAKARAHAAAHGMTYVSPYNDLDVIAGQGTLGLELDRQLARVERPARLDAVFIALGGGGLIAGVGGFLKRVRPRLEVIACSPEASPVMHASLEAGRIVDMTCAPTLSDATAGGVEPGAVTFALCRDVVDRSVVVSEDEIAAAMRLVIEHDHTTIEGAAGVAVAGFLRERERYAGGDVAIVLCGGNVGAEALRQVLGHDG